jgi:hypothetical protein
MAHPNQDTTKNYKCLNCQWHGLETELGFDTVETCFGPDKIDMCPHCGSYDVNILHLPNHKKSPE